MSEWSYGHVFITCYSILNAYLAKYFEMNTKILTLAKAEEQGRQILAMTARSSRIKLWEIWQKSNFSWEDFESDFSSIFSIRSIFYHASKKWKSVNTWFISIHMQTRLLCCLYDAIISLVHSVLPPNRRILLIDEDLVTKMFVSPQWFHRLDWFFHCWKANSMNFYEKI